MISLLHLAAAAALLAAGPAGAQQKPRAAPAAKAESTSAARASLVPAAVTAPASPAAGSFLSAPAPAATQPARVAGETWRTTGFVGLAQLDGENAPALRGDLETELTALTPAARVSGVLSLGAARWSTSDSQSPGFGISSKTESSTVLLELVPAFRFSYAAAPRLEAYVDTGLGLAYAVGSAKSTVTVSGLTETAKVDASGAGAVLRFAAGGHYDVDARLRLGAELGLGFHYGELRGSVFTVLVGAGWRL